MEPASGRVREDHLCGAFPHQRTAKKVQSDNRIECAADMYENGNKIGIMG